MPKEFEFSALRFFKSSQPAAIKSADSTNQTRTGTTKPASTASSFGTLKVSAEPSRVKVLNRLAAVTSIASASTSLLKLQTKVHGETTAFQLFAPVNEADEEKWLYPVKNDVLNTVTILKKIIDRKLSETLVTMASGTLPDTADDAAPTASPMSPLTVREATA